MMRELPNPAQLWKTVPSEIETREQHGSRYQRITASITRSTAPSLNASFGMPYTTLLPDGFGTRIAHLF
jgi:hypothetical protein